MLERLNLNKNKSIKKEIEKLSSTDDYKFLLDYKSVANFTTVSSEVMKSDQNISYLRSDIVSLKSRIDGLEKEQEILNAEQLSEEISLGLKDALQKHIEYNMNELLKSIVKKGIALGDDDRISEIASDVAELITVGLKYSDNHMLAFKDVLEGAGVNINDMLKDIKVTSAQTEKIDLTSSQPQLDGALKEMVQFSSPEPEVPSQQNTGPVMNQ